MFGLQGPVATGRSVGESELKDRKSIKQTVTEEVTPENQPDGVTAFDVPRIPPVCKTHEQNGDKGWEKLGDITERIIERLIPDKDRRQTDDDVETNR